MADFFNEWLGTLVAVVVVLSIFACALLLWSQSVLKVKLGADGKPLPPESTGHVWDGDLTENNTPLPGWWKTLFYLTILFAFGYLALFGLANVKGSLGWSGVSEYEQEMAAGEAQYGPIFSKYLAMDIKAVAKDPDAQEIGQRLFLNNCSQCHGSDAQGGKGYPNLTDKDWLYGGEPETIVKTLHEGRNGVMPPMGAVVGSEDDIRNVANYVLSLSNSAHDPVKAALGKPKFAACAACHGADGKGNPALGAPNLTDKTWLYGGDINTITETIVKGRNNQMPVFKERLTEAKIHLLAAYVWSLSNNGTGADKSTVAATTAAPSIEAASTSASGVVADVTAPAAK
jgi:cytochrome c oxidase cbb3-type subunit III